MSSVERVLEEKADDIGARHFESLVTQLVHTVLDASDEPLGESK